MKKLIDQIVAVVATRPILESDLVDPDYPDAAKNASVTDRCQMLGNLIMAKLLINKAELDSLTVDESEIDHRIDKKLAYLISQAGSV